MPKEDGEKGRKGERDHLECEGRYRIWEVLRKCSGSGDRLRQDEFRIALRMVLEGESQMRVTESRYNKIGGSG